MGCATSKSVPIAQQQKRLPQQKVPILLFYMPSNVRDVLTRLVASHLISSETATQADRLNIRFIDIPNQRTVRKYWHRELQNNDYAAALYVADIRERGDMLMNVRTLNWFLRHVSGRYNFLVVVICSNEMQVVDFKGLLGQEAEILVLSETNSESVYTFVEAISNAVQHYNDKKQAAEQVR